MRHPVVRAHPSRVTSYFSSWQLQPPGASKLLSRHRDQGLNLGKLAGTWTRRKPHLGFLAGRRDTGLQRRWTKRLDRALLFFPPPQPHTSSEGHPGDIVGCDTPFPGCERQTASQERVERSIGVWKRALPARVTGSSPYMWNTSTPPDEYDLLGEVWRHGGETSRDWLSA